MRMRRNSRSLAARRRSVEEAERRGAWVTGAAPSARAAVGWAVEIEKE